MFSKQGGGQKSLSHPVFVRFDASNISLEWTGRHRSYAPPSETHCLPLGGGVNPAPQPPSPPPADYKPPQSPATAPR